MKSVLWRIWAELFALAFIGIVLYQMWQTHQAIERINEDLRWLDRDFIIAAPSWDGGTEERFMDMQAVDDRLKRLESLTPPI